MVKGSLNKFLLLTSLLISPALTHAQVINEILYSPSTKQWVEIYNNTDSPLDLTQYKILDNGASSTGHTISSVSGGSVPAHEYGVIVISSNTGAVSATYLYKASLGIKTTGDTVTLKKSSNQIDTFTFSDGAATGGNSYQKFDTGWLANTPTPGALNVAPASGGGSSGGSDTSTSTDSGTTAPQAPVGEISSHYSFVPISPAPDQKLTVSAGRDRLGFVAVPLKFKAMLNTNDPNTSYFWSFGDGASDQGREVEHSYQYPGDYVAVLNAKLFEYEAVSRINIKVVPPEVKVFEAAPDHITISNPSKYEINLYLWHLSGGDKTFNFPKDTIIKAGGTLILPATLTGITSTQVALSTTTTAISPTYVPIQNPIAQAWDKDTDRARAIAATQKELDMLKAELAAMPPPTSISPSIPSRVLTASPIEALNLSPSSSPATSSEAHIEPKSSWFATLKRFFLSR